MYPSYRAVTTNIKNCIERSISLQDCFMDVTQNQEFLGLPEDEVHKLLSSDDLNVPNEEEIFKVRSWCSD